MPRDADLKWLLLIHQLPAKPAYLRVKIWRRLQALGAVTVKNAVYALPANAETREDFAWLAKEIVESEGEAIVCEANFIADPAEIAATFERLERTFEQIDGHLHEVRRELTWPIDVDTGQVSSRRTS